MNAKTKSGLVLLTTLIAGLLIGGLAASAVMQYRLDHIRSLRKKQGFAEWMETVIEPTQAQQTEVHLILQGTGADLTAYYDSVRVQRRAIVDSMRVRLRPVLTPEQYQRLEDALTHGRR
ncbi:MAG: hypothetical protein RhofKO_20380 [Rhodothermales bacterium]